MAALLHLPNPCVPHRVSGVPATVGVISAATGISVMIHAMTGGGGDDGLDRKSSQFAGLHGQGSYPHPMQQSLRCVLDFVEPRRSRRRRVPATAKLPLSAQNHPLGIRQ